MIMNELLAMPLAAFSDYLGPWQIGGILLVVGLLIFLKIYKSKQM